MTTILIIAVIVLYFIAGFLVGDLYGLNRAHRKLVRQINHEMNEVLAPFGIEAKCRLCNAVLPDHYHGCQIAKKFKLETIGQ